MPAGRIGSEDGWCRQQGINNTVTYTIGLCLIQQTRRISAKILFDGDPTRPGLTGVGSDVDTGNAEICLVTANSSKEVQITCAYEVYN
jgi:hypothetical protein